MGVVEKFISVYQFLPLSPSTPQIRLLCIQPSSKHDDPIQCSLSVHNLDKSLEFTALSYEWGRPPRNKDHKPTVNINFFWTLEIQVNLNKALRHLRQPDKPLIIWVDAVCINQNDNAEKGQQVGLMAEIYGSASQTYVWLGPSANGSDLAMETLQKVGDGMLKEKGGISARQQFEDLTKDVPVSEWNLHSPNELLQVAPDLIQEYIPNASFCAAECRILLSRSYWSRMWVQQEVVLSPKPVICCGTSKVDWDVFEAGLVFINLLKHHAVYGVLLKYGIHGWAAVGDTDTIDSRNYQQLGTGWPTEVGALRRLRTRWPRATPSSAGGLSFMRVIVEAHCGGVRHEVSNLHDRLYGLSGMALDIPYLAQFGYDVTYNLSCSESYTNAARAIIYSGDVDLLAMSNTNKFERMPSWAPDWRTPMRMPRGGYPWETQFCAAKNLEGPVNVHRPVEWDDPLVLEGCIVDRIDRMNSAWRPGNFGIRSQWRSIQAFMLDVENIIWLSGEQQKKLGKWVYNRDTFPDGGLWRLPVGDQYQSTAKSGEGSRHPFPSGYLGVMKDLDRGFILDTRRWVSFRKSVFKVEFEDFPDLQNVKELPAFEESAAEFNSKDSYYSMLSRQSGTCPFVGDLGYFGLVPDSADHGDIVVIFKNAKFPYVLRKKLQGKHAGKYELVGEAYVHGIMYGEYLESDREPELVQFELV